MMAGAAHPSLAPLMTAVAAGRAGSLGDRQRRDRRRRQLDLQCNYSRAARQHKLGPGAAVFLLAPKLIFRSEEKPFNLGNRAGQGRGNAADGTPGGLGVALIFLTGV